MRDLLRNHFASSTLEDTILPAVVPSPSVRLYRILASLVRTACAATNKSRVINCPHSPAECNDRLCRILSAAAARVRRGSLPGTTHLEGAIGKFRAREAEAVASKGPPRPLSLGATQPSQVHSEPHEHDRPHLGEDGEARGQGDEALAGHAGENRAHGGPHKDKTAGQECNTEDDKSEARAAERKAPDERDEMDEARREEGQARDVDGAREMDEDDNVRGRDEGAPERASEEDTDDEGLKELVEEDEEDEEDEDEVGAKRRQRQQRARALPDYAGQQRALRRPSKKARTRRKHERAADVDFARARNPDPAHTALRVFGAFNSAPAPTSSSSGPSPVPSFAYPSISSGARDACSVSPVLARSARPMADAERIERGLKPRAEAKKDWEARAREGGVDAVIESGLAVEEAAVRSLHFPQICSPVSPLRTGASYPPGLKVDAALDAVLANFSHDKSPQRSGLPLHFDLSRPQSRAGSPTPSSGVDSFVVDDALLSSSDQRLMADLGLAMGLGAQALCQQE
ncbi:hypothetical protein Rhopal_007825-T1 [Rhodotorula paludigena]|uniref:Uncharacterized protein n=1 Tax=Rhodotorula paludigena TaxID=86838 RepID=A0AAV5GW13_9BASI|nr:hypothetical protein Rhopal_007825-T1 [Rhodotorula paludigena]